MDNGRITLSLRPDGFSESIRMVVEFPKHEFTYRLRVSPPGPGESFGGAIDTMKRRDERRRWLIAQSRQLADALANRLEDLEGWHGARRQAQAEGVNG